MHRIRYLQAIVSYIIATVILGIPIWKFDGNLDKLFVGSMIFTAGYYSAEKVIKRAHSRQA